MRKRLRSVLIRAFNMAIFHEALNGNPATAVPSVPVPRTKKTPVPVKDLDALRAAILEWADAEKRNGPHRVAMPDICHIHSATSMRIWWLSARRWLDLEHTEP